MHIHMFAVFGKAEQSLKYPDTCYVDLVDLETAQSVQMSTKKVNAGYFWALGKNPVIVDAEVQVRQRVGGGGYSLIIEDIHCRRPDEDLGGNDASPKPK